jgi:ribosomal-protein-alanine N-acetyltransferase
MADGARSSRRYHLESTRLGFGTWTDTDLPLAKAIWGDAEVTRLVGGPFDDAFVARRLVTEIANGRTHGVQYWPLFRREDGAFVGCCGLRPVPALANALELGFYFVPGAWGQGYGQEASGAAVAHAFAAHAIDALYAGHHPENAASRAVLLKAGFRPLCEVFYPPTGLMHPFYELRRADVVPGMVRTQGMQH